MVAAARLLRPARRLRYDEATAAVQTDIGDSGDQIKMAQANRKRPRGRADATSRPGRGPSSITKPKFVQTASEYDLLLQHLEGQPWVALDTESDSLFRYTPRVCLIQISTPAGTAASESNSVAMRHGAAGPDAVVDYLIDPLQLRELAELGEILENDTTEVILHAAENDILTLQCDFDFRLHRIFDTQLAARILGRQGVGLAQVLQEEFDVVSDKRMQRTNWGQRPLTPQQMAYAQMDTHYLPALRARQVDRLRAADRWEEAQHAFLMLERVEYAPPEPRTFWQMKQTRTVAEEDLGVLQTVWNWREQQARRTERPPFKVLGESALVALAHERPPSTSALRKIQGLSARQVERFGRELLAAVQEGAQTPVPRRPASGRRAEPALSTRGRASYEALRRWRTETATARGVDPDIVLSNDTLMKIAAGQPTSVAALQEIPAVGRWKAQTYGAALLKLLRNGRKD